MNGFILFPRAKDCSLKPVRFSHPTNIISKIYSKLLVISDQYLESLSGLL